MTGQIAHRRRRGMTFVELQVVIAVVVLLAALLIPSISKVRGQARASACKDNLRSIGIAMHNYADVHGMFPPGWVHQRENRSNFGWGTFLLPYVEQAPLYNEFEFTSLAEELQDERMIQVLQTRLPVFVCPDESGPALNDARALPDLEGESHPVSLASYVAINGPREWTGRRKAAHGVASHEPAGEKLLGIFGENSATRFRDITDGTSNTILVGERAWVIPNSEKRCAAAIPFGVGGDGTGVTESHTLAIGRTGINGTGSDAAAASDEATVEGKLAACSEGLSSPHPGGAHVTFADGYIRVLSESIDQKIYDALLGKSDGIPAEVPE